MTTESESVDRGSGSETCLSVPDSPSTSKPWPEYRCHKVVSALQIADIIDLSQLGQDEENDGSKTLKFTEDFPNMCVNRDWMLRHRPQVGGYVVWYADGYTSFSPQEAFESGYSLIE